MTTKKATKKSSKKVAKKKTVKKKTLTKKAETKYILFVEEYLSNFFNAKQAYLKIYKPDATERTAEVEGSKVLRIPEVREYLEKRIEERKAQAVIDANAVMDRCKEIVDADFMGTYQKMTKSELNAMPEHIRKMVTEIKHTTRNKTFRGGDSEEEEIFSVKFMSKDNALNALGRYSGANAKDNEKKLDVNVKSFHEVLDEMELDDE